MKLEFRYFGCSAFLLEAMKGLRWEISGKSEEIYLSFEDDAKFDKSLLGYRCNLSDFVTLDGET